MQCNYNPCVEDEEFPHFLDDDGVNEKEKKEAGKRRLVGKFI
jgi:hypothetical protein